MKELKAIPNSIWERVEQRSIRGTPDIIGCVLGFSFWIEVKVSFKRAVRSYEKLQMLKLERHRDAGGFSFVFTEENYKEIITFIRKFNGTKNQKGWRCNDN